MTPADLWLPGDILPELLEDWTGPVLVVGLLSDDDGNDVWEPGIASGGVASNGFRSRDACRLDCTRPEVQLLFARKLYPVGIKLFEVLEEQCGGSLTPAEAGAICWTAVKRHVAGMPKMVDPLPIDTTIVLRIWLNAEAKEYRHPVANLDLAIPYALSQGYVVRDVLGALLLPVPDGIVGRLEVPRG